MVDRVPSTDNAPRWAAPSIPRTKGVIDQAYRKIVGKWSVPVSEKIVSILEEFTDIFVKGFRNVVFGHKISVTTGASCLILKFNVLDGNLKDSTLVPQIIQNHQDAFGGIRSRAAFYWLLCLTIIPFTNNNYPTPKALCRSWTGI